MIWTNKDEYALWGCIALLIIFIALMGYKTAKKCPECPSCEIEDVIPATKLTPEEKKLKAWVDKKESKRK